MQSKKRVEIIDVKSQINKRIIREIDGGIRFIFAPHATAGITINENADPDVKRNFIEALNHLAPPGDYHQIPIEKGELKLGTRSNS